MTSPFFFEKLCFSEALAMTFRRRSADFGAILHGLGSARGVDTLSDWDIIPPTPNASLTGLWNVGKAECPTEKVKGSILENNCCHFECKQ